MNKKILFTVLISTISTCIFAQGTLQFNQVLLVNNVQQSVPAGKVWKVESVMPQTSIIRCSDSYYNLPAPGPSNDFVIVVNGNNVFVGEVTAGITSGYTGGSSAASEVFVGVNTGLFPMWLPASTTLQASTNLRYISVVEFNVIP
jgi:hypothetical protein